MNKSIIKSLLLVLAVLIVGVTLAITVLELLRSAEADRPKAGFDSILAGEDICAIGYDGTTIFAAGAGGIFRINPVTLESQELGDFSYVRCLYVSEAGLWAGTDTGLYHIVGDQIIRYTTRDGLPDDRVLAIGALDNNQLWLGTWGGAVEIALAEAGQISVITAYTSQNGLLTDNVNVINQDSGGGLWFGSYVAPRGGVSVLLANREWQHFTTKNGLLHGNITAILKRRDDTVVVGAGLYRYGGATVFSQAGGKWQPLNSLTKADGLAGEKVRSLYEDKKGRLWIGSEYDGLVIIDGQTITKLTSETGLVHNEVKVITQDQAGNYWIGTLSGLTRIDGGVV